MVVVMSTIIIVRALLVRRWWLLATLDKRLLLGSRHTPVGYRLCDIAILATSTLRRTRRLSTTLILVW